MFGFALLASAASGIVFGLAPALQSTRLPLTAALNDARSTSYFTRSRLRIGLLVAQISLSLVLLVCAALMVRSQTNLTRANPGFDPDRVHLFSLDLEQSGY